MKKELVRSRDMDNVEANKDYLGGENLFDNINTKKESRDMMLYCNLL